MSVTCGFTTDRNLLNGISAGQHGQAQFARSLARVGALRPKLRERDAAAIIHALTLPEVYRLLVRDQGWPPERYEQWLTETLISQLLPAAHPSGRADP